MVDATGWCAGIITRGRRRDGPRLVLILGGLVVWRGCGVGGGDLVARIRGRRDEAAQSHHAYTRPPDSPLETDRIGPVRTGNGPLLALRRVLHGGR